jgi:hypothetical protein
MSKLEKQVDASAGGAVEAVSSSRGGSSKVYYRVCCFVLFCVAACASFNGYYQKWHFREAGVPGAFPAASFERMIEGTASRPYVYRQMLPMIANMIDGTRSEEAKARAFQHQGKGLYSYLYSISTSATATNPVYFYRYVLVYVLTLCFAVAAVYAMYFLCMALGVNAPVAAFSAVVFILLLPYSLSVGGYFYDYPELAFFTLAFLVALKLDWWWLLPVAALGEWNKESFVLILLTLYPALRMRNSKWIASLAVILAGLVCVAVYYTLRMRFGHNPGGTVEIRWHTQFMWFTRYKYLLYETEETYGVKMVRPMTLLPMTLLLWTIARGWKLLPQVVQRHGMIAAAINIPLYFLFCAPGELRDLSMLSIVVLMCIAVNLNQWMQQSLARDRGEVVCSGA